MLRTRSWNNVDRTTETQDSTKYIYKDDVDYTVNTATKDIDSNLYFKYVTKFPDAMGFWGLWCELLYKKEPIGRNYLLAEVDGGRYILPCAGDIYDEDTIVYGLVNLLNGTKAHSCCNDWLGWSYAMHPYKVRSLNPPTM